MKTRPLFLLLFPLLLCCVACKSAPSPGETPVSVLSFDHIEAESISRVVIYYRLRIENPRPLPLDLKIRGWSAAVDGQAHDRNSASLSCGEVPAGEARIKIPALAGAEELIRLELDLGPRRGSPVPPEQPDDYRAELQVNLVYQYGGGRPFAGAAAVRTDFPRIREPEFVITAIAIMQAELINTRFRVSLRIDNPNVFPVDLSSFGYELYGAGRFWADGREEDVLHIPAQGSAETRLFLLMNFINMKRSLLDEVIALRQVRYRFTGEAEVSTGVSWLPRFRMGFDHTGDSAVYK